jgi:Recombination endonuclease VII
VTYKTLVRRRRCTRCRRRTARRGKTKCAECAVRLAHTDRVGNLRRKYKLSPEEHGRLYRSQKKQCWVCGRRNVRLVVDHDHRRRRVRALVCDTDNKVEGLLMKIGVRTLRQLETWALRMAVLRTEARW